MTSCPVYSLWFERFMVVMHKRVGDKVRQDKGVTLEVLYRIIEELEENFLEAKTDNVRSELCGMAIFVLALFLAALKKRRP